MPRCTPPVSAQQAIVRPRETANEIRTDRETYEGVPGPAWKAYFEVILKIIHIISSPAAGGIENYIRDISIGARRKGHDVCIVFMEDVERKGRDVSYRDTYLRCLNENGVEHYFLGGAQRRSTLGARMAMSKCLREFQPDLIHCHLYAAVLVCFLIRSVPVFYTHHSIKLKVPGFLYRFFDLRVRAYVGICSACSRMIEQVSRKKVYRIDNAVDQSRFPAVLDKNRKGRLLRILMVGSLRPEKNYPLIIEALGQLKDLPLKVLVAGEGKLRKELENLASNKGVQNNIQFLGNVEDIAALAKDTDFFAMCSRQEGLPISLIEATVSGLPVVVTNVGGCAEVVHQCLNGIVVDDVDASEYAEAVRKMAGDVELRAYFSLNARKYAVHYSIDSSLQKHLQMYRKER